jgi:hypothetical protein
MYSLLKSILLIYTLKLYHLRLTEIRDWVPFWVQSIQGWVPVGVESIRGWVPVGVESIRGSVHSGLRLSRFSHSRFSRSRFTRRIPKYIKEVGNSMPWMLEPQQTFVQPIPVGGGSSPLSQFYSLLASNNIKKSNTGRQSVRIVECCQMFRTEQ